jgi:hypothetical protein
LLSGLAFALAVAMVPRNFLRDLAMESIETDRFTGASMAA